MTAIDTMRQALEALEIEQEAHAYLQLGKADHIEEAITALRLAIEELEKQDPVAWIVRFPGEPDYALRVLHRSLESAQSHAAEFVNAEVVGLYTAPPQQEKQEPVAWVSQQAIAWLADHPRGRITTPLELQKSDERTTPLYAAPPQRQPLTEREVELIDGMIKVQLHHAEQCDRIANRVMAEKQKGWDMERVELLRKLKAAHGIGGDK